MPYEEHKLFTDPDNTDTLWRYMDFTKFVSLISSSELYFPSARKLKIIDPWEGTYLKKELDYHLKELIYFYKKTKTFDFNFIKEKAESTKNGFEHQEYINYISCWQSNNYESAAMWRLYLKSNEGLCIQTDINSFKKSFDNEEKKVYIGMVRYKDFENDIFYSDYNMRQIGYPGFNLFLPFIHKRKIYEHEKEYRAIVPYDEAKETKPEGIMIKVELKHLIKSIILAPSCPDWFEDLVRCVLDKFSSNKFKIQKSIVDDKPFDFDLSQYQK